MDANSKKLKKDRNIRDILEIYWRYIGDILEIYWRYIGDILEIYWRYIGDILEIYWRYIRETLEERIGAEKIQWAEDLARRKLKFAGHVMRGCCETLTQLVLEGLVEGKRDRGRQRRVWGDDLKEWTRSKNLGEVKRKAENKVEWRIMVHDLRFEDRALASPYKQRSRILYSVKECPVVLLSNRIRHCFGKQLYLNVGVGHPEMDEIRVVNNLAFIQRWHSASFVCSFATKRWAGRSNNYLISFCCFISNILEHLPESLAILQMPSSIGTEKDFNELEDNDVTASINRYSIFNPSLKSFDSKNEDSFQDKGCLKKCFKYKATLGLSLAFFASFMAALSGVLIRVLSFSLNPAEIFTIRSAAQTIIMIPLIITNRHQLIIQRHEACLLSLLCILDTIGSLCTHYAFSMIPVAEASVIITCRHIFTLPLAKFWLKENVGVIDLLIVIISVAGLIMTCQPPGLFGGAAAAFTTTRLLGIVCSLSSAVFNSTSKCINRKLQDIHLYFILFFPSLLSTFTGGAVLLIRNDAQNPVEVKNSYVIILIVLISILSNTCQSSASQLAMAVNVAVVMTLRLPFSYLIYRVRDKKDEKTSYSQTSTKRNTLRAFRLSQRGREGDNEKWAAQYLHRLHFSFCTTTSGHSSQVHQGSGIDVLQFTSYFHHLLGSHAMASSYNPWSYDQFSNLKTFLFNQGIRIREVIGPVMSGFRDNRGQRSRKSGDEFRYFPYFWTHVGYHEQLVDRFSECLVCTPGAVVMLAT
ncbi:Solute carrier family 35 member G1 [Nymphon striatum]|nr:Solute carrier family 35 member G1 [Nymphon striatum]